MSERIIEPPAYAAMVGRMVRALGKRVGDADPESLVLLIELRQALAEAELLAMEALRVSGYSLADIARPLGLSRQRIHALLSTS